MQTVYYKLKYTEFFVHKYHKFHFKSSAFLLILETVNVVFNSVG